MSPRLTRTTVFHHISIYPGLLFQMYWVGSVRLVAQEVTWVTLL